MKKKNIYVVPHDDQWGVLKEKGKRVSNVVKTQKEAIDIGREKAKSEESELLILGKNGKIRAKHSYGDDPYPPKG